MKYRKIPEIVEATQWDGNPNLWSDPVKNELLIESYEAGNLVLTNLEIIIKREDVNIKLLKGDYIIKDSTGKYFPCKSEIFEANYEVVQEVGEM